MNDQKIQLPNFDGGAGLIPHAASPTRQLLEQTKLSRLPAIGRQRTVFCVGCGKAAIDTDDKVQVMFSGCAACVKIYGRLDAAADEHDKCKRRETLERFAGGAK